FGIRLPVAAFQGVDVDDVRLCVRAQGAFDFLATEVQEGRVLGDRDLLFLQLRGHHAPGGGTREDEQDPADQGGDADDGDELTWGRRAFTHGWPPGRYRVLQSVSVALMMFILAEVC